MPDDDALAAFAAAAGATSLDEAERDRLVAAARQVRADARALSGLDLEGVEPEARPEVEQPSPGGGDA